MASYQLSKHIRVSITGREHNPPHVHVYFGGKVARVCIQDGSLLSGDPMPARVSATVLTYIAKNKIALLQTWKTLNPQLRNENS
ncbi:DUF4160 domain-containing protein [Spirosoma utsteinense]|uniref:DUF4160 domain-containing protein n=1 Tax=Spirosoma utsteinense TaxID=2585773 RepID=UPI001648F7B6